MRRQHKKAVKSKKIKTHIIKEITAKIHKKMLKKDMKAFKQLLIKLKDDVTDQIRQISDETLKQSQKDASGDMSGYTIHLADVATDSYDREFSLGLASNDRELLYEIEDSLKRIDEGTYGICGECNKPITKTRLKAIPYTHLCLKCQKSFEKK